MKAKRLRISKEKLRERFDYDPDTGVFHWKASVIGRSVGDTAGSKHPGGYISIMIDGKNYMAHRLAWVYVYGTDPVGDIDHINRVRADNRIENLRVVTRAENSRNSGRGWSFVTVGRGYKYAEVCFRDTEGKRIRKNFSCNKLGWLTAGKLAAKFVLENRPKQYQGR